MELFKKSERKDDVLENLNRISDGIINAMKPEDVDVIYSSNGTEKIEAEGDNFSLSWQKKIPDEILFGLSGVYNTPIGKLNLGISTMGFIDVDHFQNNFPRKDDIDNFLKKWEKISDGILSKLIKGVCGCAKCIIILFLCQYFLIAFNATS